MGYCVFLSYSKVRQVKFLINWGYTEIDGWFYTKQWNYYQRCEGRVVAYIELYYGYYRVHVTFRGQLGMCDIEYRNEDLYMALSKAMELLHKYKDSNDKYELHSDYYSPHNPKGYWQTIYNKN